MTVKTRAATCLVASLLLGACTDADEGSRSAVPAVEATFEASGSINQVSVVDAPDGTALSLRTPDGDEVGRGTADAFGSLVFRDVEPGPGYVVEGEVDGERQRTEAFAVLDEADVPSQSLYDGQELVAGLNYPTMRDGTELAATVRLPPGKTLADGPFPTVIEYSGYGVAPPHDLVASFAAQLADPDAGPDPLAPEPQTVLGAVIAPFLGFAVVSVQMRGSGCSGGVWEFFDLDSVYDGYDIVETVGAQPWVKGGKVGMVGISYSGLSQLFTAGTRPPSLAAITPMSVVDDIYRSALYPGGVLNTGWAKDWTEGRQADAEPAPEGGQEWAKILIEQGDEHCRDNQKLRLQTRNLFDVVTESEFRDPSLYDLRAPEYWAEQIDVPVFLLGSFQDEQTSSTFTNMLDVFDDNPDAWVTLYNGAHADALTPEALTRWYEFLSLFVADEIPQDPDALDGIIGSIYAQSAGAPAPPMPPSRFASMTDLDAARAAFEEDPRVRVLMDVGAGPLGPRSLESTSELTFPSWPPPEAVATRWSLSDDGALISDGVSVPEGEDAYLSDPSTRPDTLSEGWEPLTDGNGLGFVTAPFSRDVVLAGPASLDVQVATSDDVDLQVTLSEVRPDGQETYLTSGWLRPSHRRLDEARSTELLPVPTHLADDVQPLVTGEPVDLRVPIMPVAANIRSGSRIRVTILAPGGDRSVWKFTPASPEPTEVTVRYGGDRASSLVLPIISGTSITTPLPACDSLRSQPCRPYLPATNGG